jgi:PAS domain S-box-containing protein
MLEANQALSEILGFPSKKAVAEHNAADSYHDIEDRRRMQELLERDGVVKDFETRFRRRNGEIIWVRDSCRAVFGSGGDVLYYEGTVEDITERKSAEQALIRSEERYRNLIERQGDGLAIVDSGEVFTFANKAADEIFGVKRGGLIGRGLKEFMSAETYELVRRQTDHRKKGNRSTYEVEITRADGERRYLLVTATPWMDGNGAYTGSFAIFRDDTERHLAEQAVRHNEEKYRAVVSQSAECIFLLEIDSKKLLEANPALRRLLGYTEREMGELSVYDFVAHPKQDIDQRVETVATDRSYFLGERKYRRKDGSLVDVEVNASLVTYGGKKVLCVVSRDISERKQAEDALELSRQRLRQSQKLDSLGRLAGGVAHDFNNLMAGILGCSELLLQRTEEENPLRKQIVEIKESAERAAALTQQLLSFSRRKSMTTEALSVNDMVRGMMSLLNRLVAKGVMLDFRPDTDLHPVKADRGQLEQILLNLVLNAGDAMPAGGTVAISTANAALSDGEALPPHVLPGSFVSLSVADEGVGMSPEVCQRVFDPFFTTKEPGKGTGLGLSTVYGIVKQHKGWVTVDSEVGRGTELTVYLPARPAGKRAEVGVRCGLTDGMGTGSVGVLLVEKQRGSREEAARILTERGFSVLSASSAAEAVELVTESPGEVQLIFSNLSLPDQSGIRLADEIRTRHPEMPVLVTGTFSQEAAKLTSITEKGYSYIQKPYEPDDLLETIRRMMLTVENRGK